MSESSEHESESDALCFCPICQAPLKNLKVKFSFHINMCDVNWDDLEECNDGIDCKSESIFHFRDFSHQVLANHRENIISKRKRGEDKCEEKVSKKTKQKENRTVAKRRLSKPIQTPIEESEDDIFVDTSKFKLSQRDSEKNSKKKSSKSDTNETVAKEDVINNESIPSSDENNHEDFIDCTKYVECESNLIENFESDEDSTFNTYNDDQCSVMSQSIDEACDKKEKCKAKWNDIFKTKSKTATYSLPSPVSSKPIPKPSQNSSNKFSNNRTFEKKPKVCPYFKKIPGTGFAVDAFQYGSIPEVSVYFLSHFHSDHYIGLKKSFAHPIYCSLITANLVKKKLRVHEQFVKVLELHKPVIINQVEVTCFDANHCPGSLIILFKLLSGAQYLHVGDFRASTEMEEIAELQSAQISALYLDTTYFDPQYVFPSQKEVIDRVRKIVREMSAKYPKALFVSGSYLIGKEKVFLGVLDELKCKLWAQPHKRDVFRCIDDPTILSALTDQLGQAKLHVLPMNYFRFDRLKQHLLESGPFSHVFAFKPTGWEMGRTKIKDWINVTSYENMTIYGVPYSEHSNYEELCRFVKFVKADKIIPTVTLRNREMYSHLKQLVDSYKNDIKTNKPKQKSIDQYVTYTKV
ncbi:uncharacterized protein Snm1 [Planococcus citri]|uniref:uncharacterized protein Snm1 n=1 Tax=Planococcus citri TaxID=170843 RepID=UPI0031F95488